ncbi:hypothetical protein [Culicoidibacter larvae]|uniref:Uncharacterized protein n=1 Tax=Culicoidibacter larvae TaxID=2579976 RepID=A0A5R8QES9_9FIRM|nr:hypothetical protein [Culicoidibacter larvae]TLG76541.1 hypothetical protein FEZ08_02690 [Culicoidibacter larvae]
MNIIIYIGIAGFLICLFIMYATPHGIPGLRKFEANFRLLDMRFCYSETEINETFSRLGVEGRKAYKNYWLLDYVFIVCFLIVQLVIVRAFNMSGIVSWCLIGLVLLRALFDCIENSILLFLINCYPVRKKWLAKLSSYSTSCKFVSLYIWLAGIAGMILYMLL